MTSGAAAHWASSQLCSRRAIVQGLTTNATAATMAPMAAQVRGISVRQRANNAKAAKALTYPTPAIHSTIRRAYVAPSSPSNLAAPTSASVTGRRPVPAILSVSRGDHRG